MTKINESQTAKGYTPAALVPAAFGRARTIDGIVIHHWGSLGQRHDDVVKFFVSGPGATSAHFVVSAGRIDCLVSPQDAAWHSGNAVGNATTIGIECQTRPLPARPVRRTPAVAAPAMERHGLPRHLGPAKD
jgi:N-acetyl-anhydromuramyl-L-alanine amidase AmpD